MVNLYIKQKVFSIGDKYKVYDEFKNEIYYCESKVFSWGSKIKMFDSKTRQLLFYICQKVKFSFYRQYVIYDGSKNQLAYIKQKAIFKPKLEIKLNEHEHYVAQGDFISHNFQILDELNVQIGSVYKKYLAWGDTYELNISDNFEPGFFTAIVITIDNCLHDNND